jgi:tetratricopeptide (TPR) repeat protein
LQQRLWSWTTDHQHQHQARLTGDVIRNWFEVEDSPAIKSQTNDTANAATTSVDPQSPNSLAEWARTVDLEPLLQKRKAIHRQKRQGQPSPKKTFKKPKQSQKDYLQNLSKTLQAPSSPYSSNVKVKELYMASKEADQLGDRQLAIKLLETLLQVTPNDARIYRRLARMFSEQGHLDRARATLQQGLRRMPDNPWLWHGMATLELTHGCAKHQARRFFQKAIRVDPTFAHSYHALGTLEHNQGNIAHSMKILKQGIDYCPTNHRLHHALGDLYRGAKLLEDAKRSYRRALEHGPPVSHCFAYSSLASVAYEQTQPDEARRWLQKSLQVNNGRHAQGWIALAQLEEAEDNTEKARLVCMAAIAKYERGLIEMRQRYKNNRHYNNLEEKKSVMKPILTSLTNPLDVKNLLLAKVPRYRSGDKFLKVYRNWARLEERYGSFDSVDQVYDRASLAFPLEYKLTLDWARFHATMRNHDRARSLFMEACTKASSRYVLITV